MRSCYEKENVMWRNPTTKKKHIFEFKVIYRKVIRNAMSGYFEVLKTSKFPGDFARRPPLGVYSGGLQRPCCYARLLGALVLDFQGGKLSKIMSGERERG